MTESDLDIRLQRRDKDPLPPGALLKFQAINRGKDPSYNYRWLLYEDGRWFLAHHSGDTSDWRTPFDTDLPADPTRQLPTETVTAILTELENADFLSQPAYQADDSVEDGSIYVITARLNDEEREVIYDAVNHPLPEHLNDFTYANQ